MRDVVIFDLGGVLIDWNPRYLFRKLFDDEAAMEHLLTEVCSPAWHLQHDAGTPFAQTAPALKARHPHLAAMIDAFGQRHEEMFNGAIEGSVRLLERLSTSKVPLYALTNFPAETFPWAREHYPFLDLFRDIVVSGEERITKPDPRLYQILLTRNAIDPKRAVYIDDNPPNVAASRALDLHGIHFTTPTALEKELLRLGLL